MDTPEYFENHDCHLNQEDSCEVCENYFWENVAKNNEDFDGRDRFLSDRAEVAYSKQGKEIYLTKQDIAIIKWSIDKATEQGVDEETREDIKKLMDKLC